MNLQELIDQWSRGRVTAEYADHQIELMLREDRTLLNRLALSVKEYIRSKKHVDVYNGETVRASQGR